MDKKKINQIYILVFIILVIIIIFYIVNYNILDNSNLKEHFHQVNYSENTSKIPKIIIQTWKDNDIPDKYKNLVASFRRFNPESEYKYLFFDDNAIDKFLRENYPEYYKTFLKLPVVIQKIDFFRYIAVYHYGGFYFDLDMECYKSLDSLLNYDAVFPIDTHIGGDLCLNPRFSEFCDLKRDIFLGQYAFGAKPKNEFIKLLIDNIHNNIDRIIKKYNSLKNKKNLYFVYRTTGPDYVSYLYFDYKKKDSIKILEFNQAQFFGEYARHIFMGTWK